MQQWELWVASGPDGSSESFFSSDNPMVETYRKWAQDDGGTLVWTTTANGTDDAMRQVYRYLGRGEYQPMLREDGTPYPEGDEFGHPDPPRAPDRS